MKKLSKNTSKNKQIVLINAVSIRMGGGLTYLKNLIQELSTTKSLPNSDGRIRIPRVRQLADEGTPFGCYNFIICLSKDSEILKGSSENLRIIRVDVNNSLLGKLFFNQFRVRRLLGEYKVDVLFQMANFAMILCPCKQIILLRQSHYFSKIFLENVYPLFSFKRKLDLVLRRFLIVLSTKIADRVMVPSRAMIGDVKNFTSIPAQKVFTNHYGTYLEKFQFTPQESRHHNTFLAEPTSKIEYSNEIKIFCSSNYGEHKNFTTLFEAVALLDRVFPKKFSISLPFDFNNSLSESCVTYEKDKILLAKAEVIRHLKLKGRVLYSKIADFYKEADIFIWPTLTESFGHPLVEAMASGLPIVASDIPINREICKDAAIYFLPFDPEDLVDKMKLVIDSSALRQDLTKKSLQRSKLFRWESHVQRLLQLLNQLTPLEDY